MNTFRQRCASALTHPVTLASLALLLLNDIVFKSLWPGAWVTGKLSDLAWAVFASPLLVFLLSFVAGRNVTHQRAALTIAYAGLPLLYAAFNTFASLHAWILRGISMVSGGTAGSPLDATDSIVIPLGWAIAVWVWRRQLVSPRGLRLRLTLLIAAIACVASIATSEPRLEYGIRTLTVSDDGEVYASDSYSPAFRSIDGGITWSRDGFEREGSFQRGTLSARAPNGIYSVEGNEIVLTSPKGERLVVYSTGHLTRDGNRWVQEQTTSHLGNRKTATQPYDIVFEPKTGNIIVALGIQGVIVGTPDGAWAPLPVGNYVPSDFSFAGKTSLLVSHVGFLIAVTLVPLVIVGIVLFVSQYRKEDVLTLICNGILGTLACAGFILLIIFGGPLGLPFQGLFWAIVLIVTPLVAATVLSFTPKESNGRKLLGSTICILCLLSVLPLILSFGTSNTNDSLLQDLSIYWWSSIVGTLGVSLLILVRQQLAKHWRIAGVGLLGTTLLMFLTYFIWLHIGIPLGFAQFCIVVLLVLFAVILTKQIKSNSYTIIQANPPGISPKK